MHIKFHPAFENPVGATITIFLGFCTAFAMAITLLSFGRYGYAPPVDFFWSLFALLLYWNVKVEMEQEGNNWRYSVRFFKFKMVTKLFDSIVLKSNGKFQTLTGIVNGKEFPTLITGDNKFVETSLSGLIK